MKHRYIKSIIGVFIAASMFLMPIQVQADQVEGRKAISVSQKVVNTDLPKSARSIPTEIVQAPLLQSSSSTNAYSLSELQDIVSSKMYNRVTSFSVRYQADTSSLESDIDGVINDIFSQDDYLKNSCSGYSFGGNGYENDITLNFQFSYLTTKSQEDFVNSKVSSILEQIISTGMSSDQKEKVIHDYIVKNVQYDTSLQRFSAYNALSEGKTVCQGYALLAYKMLNQVGIETRIVTGKANNGQTTEGHAWNLVKLNGNWYQLDCTWDDPDYGDKVSYDYYNITDSKMEVDHFWTHSEYPSATTVYKELTAGDSPSDELSGDGTTIDFSNYKKWSDSVSTVASNKVWNVKFTKAFDSSTVNSGNVVVYKEYNNLLYAVKNISVTYNDNKDTIYVTPTKEYTSGTYYLVVTQKVLSKDGKVIPKPIVVIFKV